MIFFFVLSFFSKKKSNIYNKKKYIQCHTGKVELKTYSCGQPSVLWFQHQLTAFEKVMFVKAKMFSQGQDSGIVTHR